MELGTKSQPMGGKRIVMPLNKEDWVSFRTRAHGPGIAGRPMTKWKKRPEEELRAILRCIMGNRENVVVLGRRHALTSGLRTGHAGDTKLTSLLMQDFCVAGKAWTLRIKSHRGGKATLGRTLARERESHPAVKKFHAD